MRKLVKAAGLGACLAAAALSVGTQPGGNAAAEPSREAIENAVAAAQATITPPASAEASRQPIAEGAR